MVSWNNCLDKVIDVSENKEFNFKHIEEMSNITITKKLDMSYDFYIQHDLHAVEWKLNAMINKNKKLIKKFIRMWKHPLNRKFESYCI